MITIITTNYFFGGKEPFRNEIRENIDRGDCLAMVISKKFQHQSMVCEKDKFKSILEPKIEHSRLKDPTFHSYHFNMNKVEIKGYQFDIPLFANGIIGCRPRDLFCQMNNKNNI